MSARRTLASWLLLSACVLGCGAGRGGKSALAPRGADEPRVGTAAIDHLPRSAEFSAHVNGARLRRSALYMALLGLAKSRAGEDYAAFQEKACGFPLPQVVEDAAFAETLDGKVLIARVGVSLDELQKCWKALQDPQAERPWPSAWPPYQLAVRDGLALVGDPLAVQRLLKAPAPSVADPLQLALAGEQTLRARGAIELGPFRHLDLTLETEPGSLRLELALEGYSERVTAAVQQRLTALREQTLERSRSALARQVLRGIRLSAKEHTLEVRLSYHGAVDDQLRYLDVLVELLLASGLLDGDGEPQVEGGSSSVEAPSSGSKP